MPECFKWLGETDPRPCRGKGDALANKTEHLPSARHLLLSSAKAPKGHLRCCFYFSDDETEAQRFLSVGLHSQLVTLCVTTLQKSCD